jgi:endogenous inhibitor of DNA gyrase (YacG/DUF329 family)
MHKIDLRSGTGLFVSCPACKNESRIGGSKHGRVIMAFNSLAQAIQSKCSVCNAQIAWTPKTAKVVPL